MWLLAAFYVMNRFVMDYLLLLSPQRLEELSQVQVGEGSVIDRDNLIRFEDLCCAMQTD